MELKYDSQADALYISFESEPCVCVVDSDQAKRVATTQPRKYAYGVDLDDQRRIDYSSDNTPIGVELLYVSEGVNVDGLPRADEISQALTGHGFKAYFARQTVWESSGYTNIMFQVQVDLSTSPHYEPSSPKTTKDVVPA